MTPMMMTTVAWDLRVVHAKVSTTTLLYSLADRELWILTSASNFSVSNHTYPTGVHNTAGTTPRPLMWEHCPTRSTNEPIRKLPQEPTGNGAPLWYILL